MSASDEAAVDNVVDVTDSVVRTTCEEVASTVVASTVRKCYEMVTDHIYETFIPV